MRKSNIFIVALIFAIWSVVLFYGKQIGLSMILFVAPLSYYLVHLLEKNNKIKNQRAKILLIPIILLASTYLIYNNQFFNNLNLIIIPFLIIVMLVSMFTKKFNTEIWIEKAVGMLLDPIAYCGETLKKVKMAFLRKFKLRSNEKNGSNAKKVFKGILITIPIALIIIGMLASADTEFSNALSSIVTVCAKALGNIKFIEIIARVGITVIVFIYLASFFDNLVSKFKIEEEENESKTIKDNTTIKILITTLNIIYLIFAIIQIKAIMVREININYANYARQGFFQLMIISVINLIMILIAKRKDYKDNNYTNIMCLFMIFFTFILIITSAIRMYFYEQAYGYTFLRLAVYIALFTEVILLIPTILYVLNKKKHLIKTYFSIIVTIYVIINLVNIDNIIVSRNVTRYLETGKIDMAYIENSTGTDAVKQIIRILESDKDENGTKQIASIYLINTYEDLKNENTDFRDFNISKAIAKYLIEEIK